MELTINSSRRSGLRPLARLVEISGKRDRGTNRLRVLQACPLNPIITNADCEGGIGIGEKGRQRELAEVVVGDSGSGVCSNYDRVYKG